MKYADGKCGDMLHPVILQHVKKAPLPLQSALARNAATSGETEWEGFNMHEEEDLIHSLSQNVLPKDSDLQGQTSAKRKD